MASQLDTRVKKNNSFRLIYQVTNRTCDPVDITGFVVKYEVRKTLSSNPVISKASTDINADVFITDAINGVITIFVRGDDTKDLPMGEYFHEVVLTDPFGNSTNLSDISVGFPKLYLVDQIARQD